MILKVILAIASLFIVVLIAAFFRADSYVVNREILIRAPEAAVFTRINNLKNMDSWSPWTAGDAKVKKVYSGPEAGLNAVFAWSEGSAGEGKMTVIESVPPHRVRLRLDFIKPFASTADSLFLLSTEKGQTRVQQQMSGDNLYIGKLMGLFMNFDQMLGKQFDKGLKALKEQCGNPTK